MTTAHHRLLDGAVRRRGAVRPDGPNPRWSLRRTTRLIVVLGAVALAGCRSAEEAKAPPPMDVQVIEVAQKDVPVSQEWIGTLSGYINAVIRPQVKGYVPSVMLRNYRNYMKFVEPKHYRVCVRDDDASGKSD